MTLRLFVGMLLLVISRPVNDEFNLFLGLGTLAAGFCLVLSNVRRERRHMYLARERDLKIGDRYLMQVVLSRKGDDGSFTVLCALESELTRFAVVETETEEIEAGDVLEVRGTLFGGNFLAPAVPSSDKHALPA